MSLVPQAEIDQLGGDWAGYGELTGQALLDLIVAGKISLVPCDKGLIVGVEKTDGSSGRYNLKHTDLADF